MRSKRIVFVINSLKIGGAAKMIQFVASNVSVLFDDVTMVSIYDSKSYGDLPDTINRADLGVNSKLFFPIRFFLIITRLRRFFKKSQPDYICSFVCDVAFFTRVSSLGLGAILISAERGDPGVYSRLYQSVIRWTYSHSDYCFFQLERARDHFGKIIKEKSFVIPNPYVAQSGVTPFNGPRKKTIVSAGRFTWQKGFDILIKAFARVLEVYPEYQLLLYGSGPLEHEYHMLCRELGIENKVLFPGYVECVPKAIREEGLFVLSSRFEGIPNVLIEAMSVGIPTVSTDCTPGGADFLTCHGKRGLLGPIDDVQVLSDNICKLIGNESLYKYLEVEGPKVLVELNPKTISQEWQLAFSKIIAENQMN